MTQWIIITVVFLLASIIKGATGFGFSLFTLPVLLFWFPLIQVIPILTACNLLSSLIIVIQNRVFSPGRADKILIGWGVVGTAIGVFFLKNIASQYLIIALAVIFIILSFSFLLGYRFTIKKPKRAAMVGGLISGLMTGIFSISGPPLTIFLTSLKVSNQTFRNVFAWFNVFVALFALLIFIFTGIATLETLNKVLFCFPLILLGAFIGRRFNESINSNLFQKIVFLICLCASIMLLFKP